MAPQPLPPRTKSRPQPISATNRGDRSDTPSGELERGPSGYSFEAPNLGLHVLTIHFANGKRRALRVVRVGEDWLQRMRVKPGTITTRAQFIEKARLVIRSMLRHRCSEDGVFPSDLSPQTFGGAHYGDTLKDFPA